MVVGNTHRPAIGGVEMRTVTMSRRNARSETAKFLPKSKSKAEVLGFILELSLKVTRKSPTAMSGPDR